MFWNTGTNTNTHCRCADPFSCFSSSFLSSFSLFRFDAAAFQTTRQSALQTAESTRLERGNPFLRQTFLHVFQIQNKPAKLTSAVWKWRLPTAAAAKPNRNNNNNSDDKNLYYFDLWTFSSPKTISSSAFCPSFSAYFSFSTVCWRSPRWSAVRCTESCAAPLSSSAKCSPGRGCLGWKFPPVIFACQWATRRSSAGWSSWWPPGSGLSWRQISSCWPSRSMPPSATAW